MVGLNACKSKIFHFRLKQCSSSKTKMVQDNELLPDFPPGPLDLYRKQASFDWKKLKLFLEDESIIELKVMFEPIIAVLVFF